MGSFNHTGNFSNLPIQYGERIVVMVGFSPKTLCNDYFAPGPAFTPVSVPIRGKYNDYGGIDNVDMTPGIEVLEKYFGMDVVSIVEAAERISAGCESQIDYDKIKKVCDKMRQQCNLLCVYDDEMEIELTYVMEHERIFDYLVSTASPKIADHYETRTPHEYIEMLGYSKKVIGNENNNDTIEWTHKTLPTLRENYYVWLADDFRNYSKVSHNMRELCERIGCAVPEELEKSYLETQFMKQVKQHRNVYSDTSVYSFSRSGFGYGLFNHSEGTMLGGGDAVLASFGEKDKHLDKKYMKECCELAAFINALKKLNLSWGVTMYYCQDVNYDNHIGFLKECISVAEKSKHIYE